MMREICGEHRSPFLWGTLTVNGINSHYRVSLPFNFVLDFGI
jgi:hypothetical protein